MNFLNRRADSIMISHMIGSKERIVVKPGKCRINFRCHMNTVHDAVKKNHDKIAMCFCIRNKYDTFIHFVNVNKRGEFVDNTLGYWVREYDYYLIRYIDKDHFNDVSYIFDKCRKELRRILPPIVRMFSNVKF